MTLQIRRGTDSDRLTITPAIGELIFTTDTKELYVGDGSTVGGNNITTDSSIVTSIIDSAYVQARQSTQTLPTLGNDFVDSAQTLILIDANALDSGRATSLIDSAYVTARTPASTDSATTIALIDSAYVQARQDKAYSSLTGAPTIPAIDTDFVDSARVIRLISNEALDSDLTIALVDSAYIQLRDRFQDSSLVTSTVTSSYVQARQVKYDTSDFADSAFVTGQGYITSSSLPVLGTDFIDSAQALILIDANALDSARASSLIKNNFDSNYSNARDSASTAVERNKHDATTKNFAVTVVTKTADHVYNGSGSSLGYSIDGTQSPIVNLKIGRTYRFTLSSSDMSSHPFRFYYDAAKTTEYTTNVTTTSTYAQIQVTEATPPVLHYQCSLHGYMGHALQIGTRNLTGFTTDNLSQGSTNIYFDSSRVTAMLPKFGTDFIDSAAALTLIDANALDSGRATSLINAAYIQARQSLIDSALTTGLIDSAYIQLRQSGGEITIQEEGSALSTAATTLNFVGSAVTATGSGTTKTITITQAAGGTDSAATIALIDANALDSGRATSLIDSAYVQLRQAAASTDSALVLDLVRANSLDSAQSLSLFSAHGMSVNTFVYTADSTGKVAYEGSDDNGAVMSLQRASKNFRVSLNGILLVDSADYVATDNKITLNNNVNVNDVLQVETFSGTQGVGSMSTFRYTATAGQLTFSGSDVNNTSLNYKPGDIIVSLNGIILVDSADYTATNGTSIVLQDSAALNDELIISAFTPDTERKWSEKTGNASVASNTKNIVKTSAGAIQLTFPASPVFGDEIRIIDGTGNAATNNITLLRNGNKFQSSDSNFIIDIDRAGLGFVYYDDSQGWVLIEN